MTSGNVAIDYAGMSGSINIEYVSSDKSGNNTSTDFLDNQDFYSINAITKSHVNHAVYHEMPVKETSYFTYQHDRRQVLNDLNHSMDTRLIPVIECFSPQPLNMSHLVREANFKKGTCVGKGRWKKPYKENPMLAHTLVKFNPNKFDTLPIITSKRDLIFPVFSSYNYNRYQPDYKQHQRTYAAEELFSFVSRSFVSGYVMVSFNNFGSRYKYKYISNSTCDSRRIYPTFGEFIFYVMTEFDPNWEDDGVKQIIDKGYMDRDIINTILGEAFPTSRNYVALIDRSFVLKTLLPPNCIELLKCFVSYS
jgi:hypothetical protein